MTDDELVSSFTNGQIDAASFDHRAHLRTAYCLLARNPFLEACVAMRDGLQRLAEKVGKPGLYHETITVAFMSLVSERMGLAPGAGWELLLSRNPDLLDRKVLERFYLPATLASPVARARFVLADRAGRA
jgi:hypothetical protein